MSATKKRKVYSPEFKAKVGLEAVKGVKSINETGKCKMEPVKDYSALTRLRSSLTGSIPP